MFRHGQIGIEGYTIVGIASLRATCHALSLPAVRNPWLPNLAENFGRVTLVIFQKAKSYIHGNDSGHQPRNDH